MSLRKINTIITCRAYSTNWEEIRIPVPWGHVAGKWWGPQNKRPILGVHGWQDNCGSFDTLIPLLPKASSFLVVDLPGCGYSSKPPPGMFNHFTDTVVLLRRVIKYYNWNKVSLMGHSMGGMLTFTYTMIYPDDVDCLILLDGFTPFTSDNKIIEEMPKDIDNFLKYDDVNNLNDEPPSYLLQEMEQKVHESLMSVAIDKSKYILARNIKSSSKAPNKFYFTTDARLKVLGLFKWQHRELVANASRLKCPIILIKVDKSPFFKSKDYGKEVIDVIKKNNKNFEIHDIIGAHHIHLNNPESVGYIINQFLKKYDIGDRTQSGIPEENVTSAIK